MRRRSSSRVRHSRPSHARISSVAAAYGNAGQAGYAVATSKTPTGPFTTVVNSTKMAGHGRSDGAGDFNILVDDDGAAYHVRDGFVVVRSSDDYLSSTDQVEKGDDG